jgi:hypothetical protein
MLIACEPCFVDRFDRLTRRIDKFFDLSAAEQRRMLHALLLVIAFRLGLWTLPYRFLKRIADHVHPRRIASANESAQIARNISAMARYVPGASCLTQALTAQVLLQRDGFSPHLVIGVAHGENRQLKAHAWIEMNGRIIIGDLGPLMVFTTMHKLAS